MKVITVNIRSFGGSSGKGRVGWFRKMRLKEKPDVVLIQETKCKVVKDEWIERVWGSADFMFVQKPMIGKSGGMLTIWDPKAFIINEAVEKQYYISIKGKWVGKEHDTIIVNVYGPHKDEEKRKLFESLEELLKCPNDEWILGGDFNEVRPKEERQNSQFIESRAKRYNSFIEKSHLLEIPLVGRRFTRICDNGLKFSKLDRFLVNDQFLHVWGDVTVIALDRGTSDHCPIAIRNSYTDFGPKPFKVFDLWLDSKEAEKVVIEAWNMQVSGKRDNCNFRDKLKNVKMALREWTKRKYGCIDQEIEFLKKKQRLSRLKQTLEDLKKALDWFWGKETLSRGCNASFMTLIPKKSTPMNLGEYRPISLIGSLYKILAKILSKRLQRVIHKVISVEQSAFMKGRFILDGILVAYEVIGEVKRKKEKCMIFKADVEKAFDSINHNFLSKILEIMGFGVKWRNWISSCLSSASVSILVNGSPTDEFALRRGIRQGDPLSPYLFIIVAEGLNAMIKQALQVNLIKGIEVGKDRVIISHLQYADDTTIFGEWNRKNISNVFKVLKCFEIFSGLKVNVSKSCLFGVGVSSNMVEAMASRFRCQVGVFPFMYLGLPIGCKMKNIKEWEPYIDKFHKRLDSWKAKLMSFGGRLTLIKSVLSSLPLYDFSLFRAPSSVINKLEGLRRLFFWGGSGESKKLSWVKWEDVLCPFEGGGLNIGSLRAKNLALLAKWWWRFLNDKHSLWSKTISSLYGRDGGLGNHSSIGSGKGAIWKNISKARIIVDNLDIHFTNSFVKVVCKGDECLFWHDKWLDGYRLKDKFGRLYNLDRNKDALVKNRCVKDESGNCSFSWDCLRNPRGRAAGDLQNLCNLVQDFKFAEGSSDKWACNLLQNGSFTVLHLSKLIDEKLLGPRTGAEYTDRVNIIPKKIGLLVWRAKLNRIPVRVELDKRWIDLDSVRCPVCDKDIETVEHIFIQCDFAKDL
ncbi:uncharacterized protein [Rutidosis leptorrhynchoides]|uniref:uncharacterized protein n=1 Tax=Rutidosis leptorrhynchoides TaxID=125765 RepID=UPI003A9A579C